MITAKQIIDRIKQGGQITDWERANVPFSADEMIEAGLRTEKVSDVIGRQILENYKLGRSCFLANSEIQNLNKLKQIK